MKENLDRIDKGGLAERIARAEERERAVARLSASLPPLRSPGDLRFDEDDAYILLTWLDQHGDFR